MDGESEVERWEEGSEDWEVGKWGNGKGRRVKTSCLCR